MVSQISQQPPATDWMVNSRKGLNLDTNVNKSLGEIPLAACMWDSFKFHEVPVPSSHQQGTPVFYGAIEWPTWLPCLT